MKLLIDIPEHIYEHAKETSEDSRDEFEAMRAIAKGLLQENCGDAISRQAVLDGLARIAKAKAKSDAQKSLMGRVMFFTERLPSVTPQPKTGMWIEHFDEIGKWYECDQCHTDWGGSVNYCPNCGAKMEVEDAD